MRYKTVTPDGWEIKPGDTLRSFRGEEYIYKSCYHKGPPSNGHVVVTKPGSTHDEVYYPSVFNCKVVPK